MAWLGSAEPRDMLMTPAPWLAAYLMPWPIASANRGFGVVRADPGFLVVQDDPDGEHPGGGRDADDPARPARPAAVPGDERGDERPVQVGRLVAGRVGAQGVVRPGADRPGQVRRAGVHAGVQDADGHPAAPAHPPGGRGVDGLELGLLGRADLGSGPLAGAGPGHAGARRAARCRGGRAGARPATAGRRPGRGRQRGPHPDRPGQHDHCRRAQLTTAGRFSGARISRASCPAALNAAASYSPVAAAGRPSA